MTHPTYTKPKDLAYLLTIEIRKRFWEQQAEPTQSLQLNYIEIYNAAQILGRPVLKADDYQIEEKLDLSTSFCYFDNSVLKFGVGVQAYKMTTADINNILDLEGEWDENFKQKLHMTYNAAHMIRYGYSLEEEKGRHIIITSRYGVRHYTDGKRCTCNDSNLQCAHVMLATHYLENRLLWKRLA